MTVYELIQELCQCDANAKVNFEVLADFKYDAEFDREKEDIQEIDVSFNESVELHGIGERRYIEAPNEVTIRLSY